MKFSVMQAICTSSLDNGELWLQVEEAHNVVQSSKKFLWSQSSRLAAELLDDASILLSKHIQEVTPCCFSCPYPIVLFQRCLAAAIMTLYLSCKH